MSFKDVWGDVKNKVKTYLMGRILNIYTQNKTKICFSHQLQDSWTSSALETLVLELICLKIFSIKLKAASFFSPKRHQTVLEQRDVSWSWCMILILLCLHKLCYQQKVASESCSAMAVIVRHLLVFIGLSPTVIGRLETEIYPKPNTLWWPGKKKDGTNVFALKGSVSADDWSNFSDVSCQKEIMLLPE